MGQELTDAEAWRRAQAGDAEAFGLLYSRHLRSILAYCLRRTADPQLAEDLTAAVFLEAWRGRRRLELGERTARPLLFGIATNLLHRHWRTLRRHRAAIERARVVSLFHSEDHEEAAISRVDAERGLRQAAREMQRLPRDEREALALIAWGELSYGEAAAALRVPIGTVKSRVARARDRIRRADGGPHQAPQLMTATGANPTEGERP